MCRKPVGEGAKRVTTAAPVASVVSVWFSVATTKSFTHFAGSGGGPGTGIGGAPSMATWPLQTPIGPRGVRWLRRLAGAVEARAAAERERIALRLPVALGAGVAGRVDRKS